MALSALVRASTAAVRAQAVSMATRAGGVRRLATSSGRRAAVEPPSGAASGAGSAPTTPPPPTHRPWWRGPPKAKYDPFDANPEVPMPFTKPMSTFARISTAATVLAGLGATGWVFAQVSVPADSSFAVPEDAPLTERLAAKARYIGAFVMGEHAADAKLLPDPLPPPYFPEYTLVLDLEGTLVRTVYDNKQGFVTIKRPGLDEFLKAVSVQYEVVVFSDTSFTHAGPIVQQLDPYSQYVMYSLYKDSCRMVGETPVKDLSLLNRRLNRVISVDDKPNSSPNQPTNVIRVRAWNGDPADRELALLLPLLEAIYKDGVDDVRVPLATFGNDDVGRKYAEFVADARRKRGRPLSRAAKL